MAGDWIKMRGNLWDDPRVARICDLTDSGEATVIGGLYWLWATADQHSEDGVMNGLTIRSIDRKTGITGFGDALVTIGWLSDHPEGVRVCHFEEHNGTSAKSRLMTAKRVAAHKANATVTVAPLPEECSTVSDALPREREEKEKELKTTTKSKAEATQRGSRLPATWIPSYDDARFCETERPDLDTDELAASFRDYWTAVAGSKGCKLDWSGTWRNWVRSQRGAQARAGPVRPEKFDPLAYVNRNRDRKMPDERTIEFNELGEPV